jgi:hypothetical protein
MKKLILFLLSVISGAAYSQGLSLPYYSGFDTPQETAGWQQFRSGFPSTSEWSILGGGFSGSCISHDYNVGGGSNDTVIDWFVSPPLNITSQSKITLKLNTGGFSNPFPDGCEVWFGTGSPDPTLGNFTMICNLSEMTPENTWLDTIATITTITDSGYIAFKYKTIDAAWNVYSIDNINVSPDSTVGITTILNEELNSISVFPNPFCNATSISLEKEIFKSSGEIIICDMQGRVVRTIPVINDTVVNLQRDDMKSGTYQISVCCEGKIISSRKIVIE